MQVVAPDLQRRVILPLIGIADLRGEGGQLLVRARFRLRRHPLERIDPLAQGGAQIRHQLLHLRLRFRREVRGNIELPDLLAERAVHFIHRALPALALLRLAAQRLSVEREARVIEALRQIRCVVAQVVERQIRLECRQRRALEKLGQIVNGRELAQDQILPGADRGSIEKRLPGKAGRVGEQLLLGARVVSCIHITPLLDGPLHFGRRGLERHDVAPPSRCGIGNAAQGEHLLDVGHVLVADVLQLRIILQVVVAIRQAEAATG